MRRRLVALAGCVVFAACDVVRAPANVPDEGLVRTVSAGAANAAAQAESGGVERAPFIVPDTLTIPEGPAGRSIRRGRALVASTRDSFPRTVRSALRCTSCHLDGGTRANVMPWVGVAARFPQYRARSGAMVSLEERVRGCFARSLNATPPARGARDLVDIVAYLTWLSRGTPIGRETEGQGLPALEGHAPDREGRSRGVRGRMRALSRGERERRATVGAGAPAHAPALGTPELQHRRRDGARLDRGELHPRGDALRPPRHPDTATGP
jgi:hypothetical protein